MNLTDHLARARSWLRARRGLAPSPYFDLEQHRITDPAEARRVASASGSEIARLTYQHRGRTVDKWTHYLDLYERHFAPFRGKPLRMLEIGVFKGGSLEIWRDYFGPEATIFGIDINPECAGYVDPPNQVRIGSQADEGFLRKVVAEMGGIDIVLDDGSHIAPHQRASFKTLFPLLASGGVYAIEDVHTAYWPGGYEGGYRRDGSAIELAKTLIDDMHGWYHNRGAREADRRELLGVHFYDSIVFVDKGLKDPPRNVRIPLQG